VTDLPGVRSPGDKMVLLFTCNVCNTRSGKQISKQGYEQGCVVVRCPHCKNLHLIADRLGIFEDPGWNIESYLQNRGEEVRRVQDEEGVMEITFDDVAGKSKLLSTQQTATSSKTEMLSGETLVDSSTK
jgi:protein import protein ZIM17